MDIRPFILVETKTWLAVNKPAGISVERQLGASDTLEDLVLHYLSQKESRPFLGIVHRLDRLTSGVLLLAKKKNSLRELNLQFSSGRTTKIYLALTLNAPNEKQGTLRHWLQKDQTGKKAIIVHAPTKEAKEVTLKYKIRTTTPHGTLWEIQLLSGKFHQIRAQLAASGFPIIGDALYGGTTDPKASGIALHAWKLSFNDPETGVPVHLEAPIPLGSPWTTLDNFLP